MSIPELQITDHSLLNGPNSLDKCAMTSTTTARKSLHQNIFGKLRPLPFQYHWTVWYDKNNNSTTNTTDKNKKNLLYILHEDVADIATFYRVYNNYPWDKVRVRDSVHVFRQGVKPVWDDPQNQNGGCWQFRVPKSKAQAVFHELVILCMANEFQAVLEKGWFSFHCCLSSVSSSGMANWFQNMTTSLVSRRLSG